MLLVISVMPLMAQISQGPITAKVSRAVVVFGPGMIPDRSGEAPAPRFKPKLSGELHLDGLNSRQKPRFRFWLVKAGDEEKMRRASPSSLRAKALSAEVRAKTDSGYPFEIRWRKATVDPEDRLYVEVFLGRRRATTAISAIQSQYLPVSRPRTSEEAN
jgi:hypothetical protein